MITQKILDSLIEAERNIECYNGGFYDHLPDDTDDDDINECVNLIDSYKEYLPEEGFPFLLCSIENGKLIKSYSK